MSYMTELTAVLARLDRIGGGNVPADYVCAYHIPAANTKATCTIAAPGAGKALLITSIDATLLAGVTAVTGTLQLKDDTTVKWQTVLRAAAAGGSDSCRVPVQFLATENKSVTLEFTAASGAGTEQTVALMGRIITL